MPNTRTNAPRGALVFDLRTLGRQAGSARTKQLTAPAPDNLGLELARVPVGADMHLDVRFEAVTEGVLVTGSATAPLAGECARCLAPLTSSVTVGFTELYLYADGHPHNGRRPHDKHERTTSTSSTTSTSRTTSAKAATGTTGVTAANGLTRTPSRTTRSATSPATCSTWSRSCGTR